MCLFIHLEFEIDFEVADLGPHSSSVDSSIYRFPLERSFILQFAE